MSFRERAFREPRGLPGQIGARYMARVSAPIHEWAIDLLDPQPGQHICEIGPAHGALIQKLAARVPDIRVSAVEPSLDMVAMATKRNRALADSGRLEIVNARVSQLPFESGQFDGVVTTHTVYFWPNVDEDLAEIIRTMRPGGRLVIGFRAAQDEDGAWSVAMSGGSANPSALSVAGLRGKCASAGLVNLRAQLRHLKRRGPLGKQTLGAVVGEKRTA